MPRFVRCFAIILTATATTACNISIDLADTAELVSGKVSGILNGINNSQPESTLVRQIGLSMWRGPRNSWLWNRTGCNGLRTCCTTTNCAPVFSEAQRLQSLGLRLQYILSGVHTGVGDCEYRSFHSTPHNCSLPGGPSDPLMADWEYTVTAAAKGALRNGVQRPYFDVWNEPNSQHKVECLAHDECPFDANLTQKMFLAIYDRAFATLRKVAPSAVVVAPSLADGGPGIHGFTESVFPWLKAFLLHAHAHNSLPDVLTWHVSMVGANASLLEGHHAALKAWASSEGIPLPPIAHNEVIGPTHTLNPAATLAFLSTLDRLKAEHSCRACWTDPITGTSPCTDNSLDALLTDDCPHNHSLGPNKNFKPYCKLSLLPRSNYWATQMFSEMRGKRRVEMRVEGECEGVVDGVAAVDVETVTSISVLIGQADSAVTTTPIALHFRGLPPSAHIRAFITHLPATGRSASPEPSPSSHSLEAGVDGSVVVMLGDVSAQDVYRVRLDWS